MIHTSKSRLTSLYSDFALLKTTNLDGYRANTAAWISALTNASRAGLMPGQGRFTVRVDEELLRELETRNMGRPIALDAVVVCLTRSNNEASTFLWLTFLGRCPYVEDNAASERLSGNQDEYLREEMDQYTYTNTVADSKMGFATSWNRLEVVTRRPCHTGKC